MADTGSLNRSKGRHRFTIHDVDKMIEAGVLDPNDRFELIDGEIVPMSPMHIPHASMTLAVAAWLRERVRKPLKTLSGATTVLSLHNQVDPDIVVYEIGAEEKVPSEAVKLAVEVSYSTLRKDLRVKASLYADAGVPEYWVIDVKKRETYVHRNPNSAAWTRPRKVGFADKLTPLFDKRLNLRIADLDV